jgi:drug/metabolite transporter (DMT)-like permease
VSTSAELRAGISSETLRGLGLLLFTTTCWGVNWPLTKFLLSEWPPFTMRVIAAGGALIFGFLLAAWQGERLLPPQSQWRPLTVSALLNFTSFTAGGALSLLWLSATEAVLIAYTMPLWAMLLAWLLVHERPTRTRALALVFGLAGIAVLEGGQVQASVAKWPGIGFALMAAVLFALGTVIGKRRPVAMPPIASVAWQATIGSAPMLIGALFEHPVWRAISASHWLGLAYVATFPLFLGYVTWFGALRLLPASTAATGALLAPVIGVFAAAAALGEPLGLRQGAAMLLTLSGVALAARG